MDLMTLWLSASVLLCLAELVLPGQVALGLGLAGLLVTLLLWAGLVTTWPLASLASLVAAIPVVLAVRGFFSWMMPGATTVDTTDEDGALEGRVVQVVDTIEAGGEGRVAFGDSSWPAISVKGRLVAGQAVRLMVRAGLVWVVKPVDGADPPEPPAGDQPRPPLRR